MILNAIAIGVGLGLSLTVTRLMGSLLYGVQALDPVVILAAILCLTVTAFLACYWPARRAARRDPMAALRLE